MSSGLISKVITEITDGNAEDRAEDYVMVNVRPGEKVSAMLEVISHLTQKSPSASIANELSSQIAKHAASSENHAEAILDAAEAAFQKYGFLQSDCALAILENEGVIEIETAIKKRLNDSLWKNSGSKTGLDDT